MQKRALPRDTRKWVLNPASLLRYSRSMPMMPPSSIAVTRRIKMSMRFSMDFYVGEIIDAVLNKCLYQKEQLHPQLLFSSEGGARTLDLRIMNPTL